MAAQRVGLFPAAAGDRSINQGFGFNENRFGILHLQVVASTCQMSNA
jgi:hypothetical protein